MTNRVVVELVGLLEQSKRNRFKSLNSILGLLKCSIGGMDRSFGYDLRVVLVYPFRGITQT